MKIHVLTMVYCGRKAAINGLHNFTTTVNRTEYGTHYFLKQHYPGPSEASDEVQYVFDAGKNLGLHEGLNYMVEHISPAPEDILVAFDLDEKPLKPGWVAAMTDVMRADSRCGWLSLMSPPVREELAGVPAIIIGGHRVQIPEMPKMNTVCAWRWGAVLAATGGIGKFTEPYAYYGGIESDMMPKFTAAGCWVGWMTDFGVEPDREFEDPEYRAYKHAHVGFTLPQFTGSYEEWLKR